MTTPTETPAAPAVVLDDFGQMAKDRLVATINEHNGYAKQLKATDPQGMLDALREDPEAHPDAAKITAQIEALDNKREELWAKRDEILKPLVDAKLASVTESSAEVEAKASALAKTIAAGKKYLTDLYGDAAVADLPAVVGKRSSSGSSTGGSTGQRRIRGFDVWVDGTLSTARDGKGEQKSNLAAAAKQIGVDTEQMRSLFWGAAGTDDPKKYPAVVEFTVTVGETTHSIVAKKVNEDEPRATEAAASA